MAELSQKGLLAPGSRLFYIAVIFYDNLWRSQGGISQADGCIFLTGDIAVMCEYCLLFSDITVVAGTCHTCPALLDDAGADRCVSAVDFDKPQALSALFSAEESVVYQR